MNKKRMRNKVLAATLIILTLLLSGCNLLSRREVASAREFRRIMEAKGYEVFDINEHGEDEFFEESLFAIGDRYMIDFFRKDSSAMAQLWYVTHVAIAEQMPGNSSSSRGINFRRYQRSSADEFIIIYRVDNIVISGRGLRGSQRRLENTMSYIIR